MQNCDAYRFIDSSVPEWPQSLEYKWVCRTRSKTHYKSFIENSLRFWQNGLPKENSWLLHFVWSNLRTDRKSKELFNALESYGNNDTLYYYPSVTTVLPHIFSLSAVKWPSQCLLISFEHISIVEMFFKIEEDPSKLSLLRSLKKACYSNGQWLGFLQYFNVVYNSRALWIRSTFVWR